MKYGITLEEYDILLTKQGGKCAICGRVETDSYFCVDHDHKTKVVRGILCFYCNTALGMLSDDLETVKKAVAYLSNPPSFNG